MEILTDEELELIKTEPVYFGLVRLRAKEMNIRESRLVRERAIAKAQAKKLLLSISKKTKKLDKTTYLVPDYGKFREALKEFGIGE